MSCLVLDGFSAPSISYGCIALAWRLHSVAQACISDERRRVDLHFGCQWLHGACRRTKPKSAPLGRQLARPILRSFPCIGGRYPDFFIPPVLQSAATPYYEETQGCVMCEALSGARGLPAPALAGRRQRRQRHRAAFSAGYDRDTNGIRPVADWIRQATNRIRIMAGPRSDWTGCPPLQPRPCPNVRLGPRRHKIKIAL